MGKTPIEWVVNPDGTQGETLNPIRGKRGNWHCTKVGADCLNCYAERMNVNLGGPPYKSRVDTFRLDRETLIRPLRWRRPRFVFMCDMTDLFHTGIPVSWLALIFGIMAATPYHRYYVLTKRPEQALQWFQWLDRKASMGYHRSFLALQLVEARIDPPLSLGFQKDWPLPNVWIGTSAGTQELLDKRMKFLMQVPAAHRFASLEPLLERVDASQWLGSLDWMPTGCESGPERRPCELPWIGQLLTQCAATRTPIFVKQIPFGGKVSRQPDEWPLYLQVREFPHES